LGCAEDASVENSREPNAAANQQAAASEPQTFQFHHVHLNSVDAEQAIDFYATHFNAERGRFRGEVDAVRAQDKWLLFNELSEPPAWPVVSPLYHIGWGAPDMTSDYARLLDEGVAFETPITDISEVIEAGSGRVFFAYVDGPDHALTEINTAADDTFQHVHFLSDDPVSAGQWYLEHFGATSGNPDPPREAREHNGLQIYPYMGARLDGIQFWWYPKAFGQGSYPEAWEGRTDFASHRGRVIDHIAFSVDDLDRALTRLEASGVDILQRPQLAVNGQLRSAFVEAPDGVELEIVEGHVAD
jgi:catechol 2,3-dioxygenase-like lactoylglutathione lyase family enzyme